MIKNYFKIAWRNLRKNKVFSFINIFGLAVGFTCCLLLCSFLIDELNFDKSPENASDIYRVELNIENKDFYSTTDDAIAPGFQGNFPEIIAATRLNSWSNIFVRYNNVQFKEDAVAFCDSNFLQFFSLPFSKGNPATALKEPGCAVISKACAKKYFGEQDPIGQSFVMNNNPDRPFKVTGILGDVPENMHFKFDIYASMPRRNNGTWSNVGTYTYVKLKAGTDPKKLEAKFPEMVARYVVPEVQHDMGISLAEAQKSVNTFVFYLKPLKDIHLFSSNKDELQANGSIKYIYIFGALALFILILACVNFTNLSTAVSIKRSKEVGIRKVMGSARKQLVGQFLAESVMISLFSFVAALVFIYFLLPGFNHLAGKNIAFRFFVGPSMLVTELIFVTLVGIFAGLYPAFFMSSFNIISILKGNTGKHPAKAISLRSGLVVFQFAISIALIIATIVVFQQLHFMQNKTLGFDTEQELVINDTYLLQQTQQVLKEQLLSDSRVISLTLTRDVPVASKTHDGTQAFAKATTQKEKSAEIHIDKFHVDEDYVKTLGLKIIKGRNLSREFTTDSSAVVINESAVGAFGLTDTDPIGKTIVMSGQHEYSIIGVVKDFHYASVKEKITPMVMLLGGNNGSIIAKVKTSAINGLLADVKNKWNALNPGGPFSYSFIDEKFASVYAAEEKTGKIFTLFAAISIIIASLGLFGLSAFSTEQRTKEIGVRKVLGASIQNVVLLLSKEFLYMVLIAFILAVPLTWFAMHKWLQEFAYRISISWYTFVLAGISALLIAFLTVSFQAIRAAVVSPVKSLRTE